GTIDYIKAKYPTVKIIASNENLGFAKANNKGAENAAGDYLLFLNPDTIVLSAALDKMVSFMDENPDVAMCGPQLLNSNGTVQHSIRNFPSYRAALYRYTVLKYF